MTRLSHTEWAALRKIIATVGVFVTKPRNRLRARRPVKLGGVRSTSFGAQKFLFRVSSRMAWSTLGSAASCFRWAFSCSRSLISLTPASPSKSRP